MNTDDVIMSLTDKAALAEVLTLLEAKEHEDRCPRIRDDYDCTCGRDALIYRVEQLYDAIVEPPVVMGPPL
jgi:hypothetical protein